MPYIIGCRRTVFDEHIKSLATGINTAGELNYVISQIANTVVKRERLGPTSYVTLSTVLAQMEAAKLEFYRRIVAPYEDKKIAINGDVKGL